MTPARWIVFGGLIAISAILATPLAGREPSEAPAGKPFVIALSTEPDTLDLTATRDSPSLRPTIENIVDSLWGVNTNGDTVPTLATWKISAGGKIIDFSLRRGVRFHSGDELTAKDVVFSYERLSARTPLFVRRQRFIERVDAIDDYTVRFTFKQIDVGFFPARALYVVSKAYHDRVGERAFLQRPIGTGPYRFVAYRPGQYLDIERFDGYWGAMPQVRSVRFVFAKENTTRAAKLRAGEADVIMDLPYPEVETLARAGFKMVRLAQYPTMSVQFQSANTRFPTADVRVRRAIAHAIDGDAIVKGLFQSIPERAHPRLTPGEVGYDPSLTNYRFDPALAKRLLAEAGYPAGFKMPLYYWTGTLYGARESAEAVALYLKAVGIDASLRGVDATQYLEMIRRFRLDPNAEYVGVAPMPMAYTTDSTEPIALAFYSQSPLSMFTHPDIDAHFERAIAEPDPTRRAGHLRAAYRILHDQVATITLWNTVSVYAMKPNVDFQPTRRTYQMMQLKDVHVR